MRDRDNQPILYWVREGYSLTMVDGQPYTSLSSNGRRADVSWTGDANAKPSDILESVTSTHVQTNVTTNVGETLQQVNAGTYAGVSNSGGTEVDGSWNYIVKDSSWKGIVNDSNYRNGYADLVSSGKPRGFVRTTDTGSKLAWNATLSAYTYNGKVVDYSNIYVIDGEIGVFTNASGSEVYTGTVFGKNNEVLMTVKKSDGSYYSYWGAEVNDAGATMDTYRVAEYQKDLNVLRDNDFALYHNDIKSVDMSTNDSSATISLMRNGDGTTSPAVDGTLTITNGGGTGGNDTYVRISNTTNGQEVSKTFTTGSKVSAIGSTNATTGLTINGIDYTIKAGKDYKAGANIQISADNTISATDTKYTAGANVSIDENNVISAVDTDTKYTAGKNITIDENNVISAQEYKAGTNVSIDENNKISAKNTTLTNGPAEKSVNATSGGVTYTIKDTDGNAVTLEDVASATTVNKLIDGAKVHYFSVNASANQGNYNNDGAGNLSIAIGADASATKAATAVGNKSTADERSAAFGYLSDAKGTRAVAIGAESSTNGTNSTAIGQNAKAGYYKSDDDQVQAELATAVGSQAEVLANYGTAVGESAKVLSESGTALGMGAQIWENSAQGVAVGRGASVGSNGHAAEYGIALGAYSQAEAENGIAIGYDAVVSQPNSVALGSHATTNPVVATSSITIPNTNTTYNVNGTAPVGTVSVGSATGLRTITNVTAGRVSEISTDAVNGSELYAVATEAAKHTTITTEEGSRITVDSRTNSAGGTEYILDVDTSDLANYSLTNLSQKGKTVITNLAKEVERHIKPATYAVDNYGTVTMTYVDGNGNPVTGEAKITGIAKSDLSNITTEGNTVINNIAKKAVKVVKGENTTVTPGTEGDVTTYAVNVDTSGQIEENNTHIVTGDTVYKALQNVSWTANVNGQAAKTVKKDGTLNFVNGDNIAISNENGDIKISTTGLASSGDLWTAQAGGKDVNAVNQKVNFNSTDKHLVVDSTQDGEITFATKDLADTSFTNITKEGNTYIKKLAKGEDVHIKADTYTVGNDGSVTMTYVDGNGNPVTGEAKITGIAKSDLTNITEGGKTVINNLAKEAVKVVDGTNTKVREGTLDNGKIKTYAVDVKTDGTINKGDTNIVTGDTVYNALQNVSWKAKVNGNDAKTVKKDGTLNFVNGDNINIINDNGDIKISTTGLASSGDLWTAQAGGKDVKAVDQKVNFNSTDKHLVVESTQDGKITFATKDLADTSFKNITEEGNTYIKKLAKGEDRHIEAKEYAVSDDGSVTMTYVDGNGNPVTGEAKITGIAKSDLTNITEGGKKVINNLAKEAVKVVDGTNTNVETVPTTDGHAEYKVNLNEDVNLGDTIYLNGSDGSISAKSGGAQLAFNNSGLTVSQAKNGLTNETRIDGATITVDGGAGNQTIINGSTAHIGSVLVNGGGGTATITGLTNKTTDYTGFANGSGRAATEEQLKEVNSKATAAKTTVTAGKNIAVNGQSDENGSAYTVALADDVSLGNNNAIQLKGSDGSISATSGTSSLNFNDKGLSLSNGKNSTVINGGTITVNGGESVISGTQATFGKIKLNAESGSTITGLTNTTTDYTGFATAGRAATEEQLKEVAGQAGEAIETAGKGWNLTTNGKEASKTNIKPDGTVDFSSNNDNLLISNAGANLSFSLSDNLDLTNNKDKKGSVKVGENTTLTNELLQVGKDVSLTASALNVGNSSLTTDALMVGGLTYISSSGINANNRIISNVAAGVLDTDAVNVGQLKSAISGSQVSIKAGDGISVAKTGNQYTINVNIEGLSNEHGTVSVSTDSDSSVVPKSTPIESEMITPAPAKRMNSLLLAEEAVVAEPENSTSTGKKMYVKYTSNAVKLITDDITDPTKVADLNDGEEIFFSGDGNITTTTELETDGKNTETIRFSLNKDVKVDSIEAKNGGQINIKSEVNMNSQKITNLADGEIAEGSTDAVNGGQLYNTNQAVIANAENINSLSHSLNKLDSRINRVGAGAAALAALHPLDFDPDNKWDFAAGYGNYAGANAVAIGTYYRPNENTMFSIGGSFGGGENMINAGISFKLGSGGSGITTSKTVMAKKIKEQDELLKAQDAKMKEQDEKIAKLEALVAQQGEMIQQALGKK
ncbi:YadA-like family protein [Megasphaera sp.]|uniref:YadA-like family protein n=1 Tax=Megasphaera sp. TaxID=2023260 RepID=UPI00352295BB